jgi:hypothetical protein
MRTELRRSPLIRATPIAARLAGVRADCNGDHSRRACADDLQRQLVVAEPILHRMLLGADLDPREPVRP